MILRIFHLFVSVLYMYTLWYDQSFIELPFPNKSMKEYPLNGRSIYLTFWCMILQIIYFNVAVLNDYIGTNAANVKQIPIIRKLKDFLFTLAFPTAFYVVAAFWGIYAVDSDLIMPEAVKKVVPFWVNHVLHSAVLLNIFIELIVCYRSYPSWKIGVTLVFIFNLTYVFWFHYIYFQTGFWVYPIFNVLNLPLRGVFVAFSIGIALLWYFIGEKLNTLLWSNAAKQKIRKHK